jgi:hypothetical protein
LFAERVLAKFNEPKGEVLIAGTRGIGKSVFGLLMALQLSDSGKVVIYEHKKEKMLIIGQHPTPDQLAALTDCFRMFNFEEVFDEGVYVFGTAATQNDLFNSLLQETALSHVQDLGDDTKAEITRSGAGRKLILSSPNNTELRKQHNNVGLLILFMPRWSLEELEEARKASFPEVTEAELAESYELFGGIPRMVLEMSEDERMSNFRLQVGEVKIADLTEIFRKGSYIELPSQKTTSVLVHVIPRVNEAKTVDYTKFQCVFASEQVGRTLAERFAVDFFNNPGSVD